MQQASIETDPLVCRWAEAKYKVVGVTAVAFEEETDWGWSEYTPGAGGFLRVRVHGDGKTLHVAEEFSYADLIVDVCRFVAKGAD